MSLRGWCLEPIVTFAPILFEKNIYISHFPKRSSPPSICFLSCFWLWFSSFFPCFSPSFYSSYSCLFLVVYLVIFLLPLFLLLCCLSSHGLLHPPGLVPPPSSSSFNSPPPPPPQWAWPSPLFNISRQVVVTQVVILSRFVTFYLFNNPKNWRYPVANRPESSVAEDQKTSTSLFTQN